MDGFEIIQIRPGLAYLTLVGFNQLRKLAGMERLAPMPGEQVPDFKARVRKAREEFFRDFGHMWPDGVEAP